MEQERSWAIAVRVAVGVVAALFLVLLATGVALTFRYRPDVSDVYANPVAAHHSTFFSARRIHRSASMLFLLAAGALAVSSIGLFVTRRRVGNVAYPLVAGVAAVAASFTGFLLPWDQLSLWAVTVGTNMQGYTHILRGHDVKFVLVGNHELDTAELRRWFWVHAVALPLVFVAVVITLVLAARRTRVAQT